MKKLIYILAILLPAGLFAQQDEEQEETVKVDITITKNGETQRITKELRAGDVELDKISSHLKDMDLEDCKVIVKRRHGMGESMQRQYDFDFDHWGDEGGEAKEVAFLGVMGHTQMIGEKSVVMLDKVIKETAAQKAGLQPGDIIESVDGEAIDNYDQLVEKIREQEPGGQITLEVKRGRKTSEYVIELGSKTIKPGWHSFSRMNLGDGNRVMMLQMQEQLSDEEKSMISKKLGVELTENNQFKEVDLDLFPNPTEGIFEYEFSTPEGGELQVSVFNTAGKLVAEQSNNTTDGQYAGSLNLSEQPRGKYIVVFRKGEKMLTQKILKI